MNEIITNGTEIKRRIIYEISNAKHSIYVAMAFFTDRDIANAIIGAKIRQVNIDVILSSNAQNEVVKRMFKEANVDVHAFETGDDRGLMHHKFCLIDEKITINGSYNYSFSASNNNVENIHATDDYSVYKQFFAEFERLKYNIDNNIDVNNVTPAIVGKIQETKIATTHTFSQQLHDLVYLSTQFDTEKYKNQGYQKSKESYGSTEIFKAEYKNIREHIRTYTLDDSLSSKKNILASTIANAFENRKTNIEEDKQKEIAVNKGLFDIDTRQLADKITASKHEKSILEAGDPVRGDKGIYQINKEIEKIKLEKRSLEESIIIIKFTNVGTILMSIFLAICLFYLSIFFASALYKVFFEGNAIRAALAAGNTPPLPQVIDANAILNIFKQQGALFGILSGLLFLFPLALSNLSVLGSKNKTTNMICFWIGLLMFDFVVSGMVALNTDKIESLLLGNQSTMQIWEVVKHGEFYLIFIFGMLPLFITHYVINYITSAYQKSQKELVDAEKTRRLHILEEDTLELTTDREIMILKISGIEDSIKQLNNQSLNLENDLNNQQNQVESKFGEIQRETKAIFEDYSAKISSGKIFTDVISETITSAFQTGFITFLPEFYADTEVKNRIREIEQIIAIKN